MAWETRRYGRRFYYRSRRVRGLVVKEYVGGGERGRQAAEADAAARAERAQAAQARRARQQPIDQIAACLDESDRLLKPVLSTQLLAAGWRRHHRQWRSPRCQK